MMQPELEFEWSGLDVKFTKMEIVSKTFHASLGRIRRIWPAQQERRSTERLPFVVSCADSISTKFNFRKP